MNCFSCCKLEHKNSFDQTVRYTKNFNNHGNSFSFFLKNISLKTVSKKQKLIAEEIMKFENAQVSALVFSYKEIAAATENFNPHCVLGEGGYGKVYRGYIEKIHQVVAIKQLDRNGKQGNREFFSELLMLSLVQNPNLVKLIGYCVDGDQRILVYEFLPNGSLENHLLNLDPGKKPLDWYTRMKIAVGAARGLQFLHEGNPPIIYRDFKASNILLDADFNPRLSDFGLAKLGPTGEKEHVSTRVMGTYGYCAPEYQRTGKLTKSSDVYSFGVVFLEIITGRRVIDSSRPTEEQNLLAWAEPLFKDKHKFTALVDPLLGGDYPTKSLHQALAIAGMCLQEEAEVRPVMADVVTALEFLASPMTEEKIDNGASRESIQYVNSVKEANFEGNMEA
ncbi:hypothetical protein P3X46_020542 [Hevea brasiliensis]|uniref:Protein kinase domain-containing protein n=1 Tax=Hevea brasiliensis TaxID=3981 RepID=A0ABQ9LRD0_HEVBR|nr:hypothetical protein P3X46_020542 [Hevea brasiliensis]